jgi:hypothetical protein
MFGSPLGLRAWPALGNYDDETGSHLFIVDLVTGDVSPLALVGG